VTLDENSILESLRQSVISCDEDEACRLARVALNMGFDPLVAIERGLAAGLREMGAAFDRHDIFLPDLVIAAETMKAACSVLESGLKELPSHRTSDIRTVVIGTVQNDIHDIGKSLVALMLFCAGWNVVDLGTDVSTDGFVDAVVENEATLLGLSSLLTTTAPEMAKVISALEKRGLRSKVRVIVGGGAVDEVYAKRIGADAYGANASDAVRQSNALFKELEGGRLRDS